MTEEFSTHSSNRLTSSDRMSCRVSQFDLYRVGCVDRLDSQYQWTYAPGSIQYSRGITPNLVSGYAMKQSDWRGPIGFSTSFPGWELGSLDGLHCHRWQTGTNSTIMFQRFGTYFVGSHQRIWCSTTAQLLRTDRIQAPYD